MNENFVDRIADAATGRVLDAIAAERRINRDDLRAAIKLTLEEHLAPRIRTVDEIERYIRDRVRVSGEEAAEDEMTARIVDASRAALARGEDVALPAEVWAKIESGENAVASEPIRPLTADIRDIIEAGCNKLEAKLDEILKRLPKAP